jgi:hypothetical protein
MDVRHNIIMNKEYVNNVTLLVIIVLDLDKFNVLHVTLIISFIKINVFLIVLPKLLILIIFVLTVLRIAKFAVD